MEVPKQLTVCLWNCEFWNLYFSLLFETEVRGHSCGRWFQLLKKSTDTEIPAKFGILFRTLGTFPSRSRSCCRNSWKRKKISSKPGIVCCGNMPWWSASNLNKKSAYKSHMGVLLAISGFFALFAEIFGMAAFSKLKPWTHQEIKNTRRPGFFELENK